MSNIDGLQVEVLTFGVAVGKQGIRFILDFAVKIGL